MLLILQIVVGVVLAQIILYWIGQFMQWRELAAINRRIVAVEDPATRKAASNNRILKGVFFGVLCILVIIYITHFFV